MQLSNHFHVCSSIFAYMHRCNNGNNSHKYMFWMELPDDGLLVIVLEENEMDGTKGEERKSESLIVYVSLFLTVDEWHMNGMNPGSSDGDGEQGPWPKLMGMRFCYKMLNNWHLLIWRRRRNMCVWVCEKWRWWRWMGCLMMMELCERASLSPSLTGCGIADGVSEEGSQPLWWYWDNGFSEQKQTSLLVFFGGKSPPMSDPLLSWIDDDDVEIWFMDRSIEKNQEEKHLEIQFSRRSDSKPTLAQTTTTV